MDYLQASTVAHGIVASNSNKLHICCVMLPTY